MRKRCNRIALCLGVALLAAATVGPRAEVSAETDVGMNLLVLGAITEGPDPIPQVIWAPVRDVSPNHFLNASGGARGDGRPDAAFHPDSFLPYVVWAYNQGAHHDIAFSTWDGSNWSATDLLTTGADDELDPRISVSEAGTIYVVWWDVKLSRIWMSTRVFGISTWGDPEQVTGLVDSGRRPSILEWGGSVLIAYERDSTRIGQEVVVATRVSAGVYTTEVVATTISDSPLDVILHDEDGVLWVDWRHTDSTYAYSVYSDGSWGPLTTLPWIDDSWTEVEEVRQVIRGVVLNP